MKQTTISFIATDQITPSFLHVERAILLGKSGKHKKALQVLVHEEKDQQAAESYCWRTSAGRDRMFTQEMFLSLLQIYLESCQHVITAVDLLNKNAASFDLVSVLRVLPDSWSLKLLLRFLCESLRGTVHDKRMRGLEMSLAKVETLRHKHVWVRNTINEAIYVRKKSNIQFNLNSISNVILYAPRWKQRMKKSELTEDVFAIHARNVLQSLSSCAGRQES